MAYLNIKNKAPSRKRTLCFLQMERTAQPPHNPFYRSYRFYPFYPFKFPLRRFVTFCTFLSIFRLLKTFLSYQQVINNSRFSTQFFETF